MVQFYCLSVVMNIFAGLILVYGIDLTKKKGGLVVNVSELTEQNTGDPVGAETVAPQKKGKDFKGLGSRSVRFLIGIISILVGFIKLFSAYRGIAILGDLFPAAAGLMGGTSILLEFYTVTTSDSDFELNDKLKVIFIDSRKYIGILCFLGALLHFVVPQVIIL